MYLHFFLGGLTTLLPCWPLTTRNSLPFYDWMPYSFWLSHITEKAAPNLFRFPAPDLLTTEVDHRMPITLVMFLVNRNQNRQSNTASILYKDNKCGFEETLDNFCWCLSKNENCTVVYSGEAKLYIGLSLLQAGLRSLRLLVKGP